MKKKLEVSWIFPYRFAGEVIIYQVIAPSGDIANENLPTLDQFKSSLVMSGYSNITTPVPLDVNEEHIKHIQTALNLQGKIAVYQIHCEKPNFEVIYINF